MSEFQPVRVGKKCTVYRKNAQGELVPIGIEAESHESLIGEVQAIGRALAIKPYKVIAPERPTVAPIPARPKDLIVEKAPVSDGETAPAGDADAAGDAGAPDNGDTPDEIQASPGKGKGRGKRH